MQAEDTATMPWQIELEGPTPTSYEVLQIHPAAPLELITAIYWRLAGQTQTRRATDPAAEAELHQLTRAYQTLTKPELRAEYDASIGVGEQSPAPRVPQTRQGLFGIGKRDAGSARVDYYEILRVAPNAEASIIDEAYTALRSYYVRLVQSGYSPLGLLDYLEEAYSVTSDPERRSRYDAERRALSPGVSETAPAAPNAAKPKASAKPKGTPARPGSVADRSPNAWPAKSGGRGGAGAVGALSGALGAMSRHLTNMSRREQQQSDDRLAERELEQADSSDVEATLLQRISSTMEAPPVAAAARAIARLTVVDGPDSGTIFDIEKFPLSLGADTECDITLPGLASHQARLLYRDGRFVVYSLVPPEPGTAADSEPWWILESGDDLGMGPYKLRFTAIGRLTLSGLELDQITDLHAGG
jgi:curved DNA-binding protein CbpA